MQHLPLAASAPPCCEFRPFWAQRPGVGAGRPPGPSWRRAGPALGRKGCVRAPPLASAPAVSRSFEVQHPLPFLTAVLES